MLAATILPQDHLHLIKDRPYHMVLAHLLGAEGYEKYTEFYTHIGRDPEKFLMMDTGLIEGDARPIDELLLKALTHGVSEMAIPDIFKDKDETLRESHEALQYVRDRSTIPVMAIPQGRSLDEWVACATEMLQWPIQTIGIPKVLSHLEGSNARLHAILELQELGVLDTTKTEIHLLGCWHTPLELKLIENQVRAGKIPPVRGVDSAIAYVYTRAGIRISEDSRPDGDPINFKVGAVYEELLKHNIDIWESESSELPPIGSSSKVHRLF